MAQFNKNQYNDKIDVLFEELEEDMIALPLMIDIIYGQLCEEEAIAEEDKKSFFKHVHRYVITKHMDFELYDGEEHINWDEIPEMKYRIWNKIVECYRNKMFYDDAISEVGKMVISYTAAQKYLLWLGMYIGDALISVYDGDTDLGLEEKLYGALDNAEVVYRGFVPRNQQYELSIDPEGTIDEDGNIINGFVPESVDVFIGSYDNLIWDAMEDSGKEALISKFNIPPFLVDAFAEVYRGNPIFTRDLLQIDFFDESMEIKGTLWVTNIQLGDTMMSLVLRKSGEFTYTETDHQFVVNMGSLMFNPDFEDDYERALSALILENPETEESEE